MSKSIIFAAIVVGAGCLAGCQPAADPVVVTPDKTTVVHDKVPVPGPSSTTIVHDNPPPANTTIVNPPAGSSTTTTTGG